MLNKTMLSLAQGANETLVATVTPADATDKTVTFSSSNTDVATVTPKQGKVTAVAAGTAKITATTVNGKTAT
ncbi:Ig-like domain-containing protein, partial [Enterococcus faecalis]